MLKSVDFILHPPELRGRDRWRYWLSAIAWLVIIVSCMTALNGLLYLIAWMLIEIYGEEGVSKYEELFLVVGIINVIIGVLGGDRIWSRLFIQTGYLSDAATIRVLSNRAPTITGERRHRWLGQAILLVVYVGIGIAAMMAKQWWLLIIVVPLGVWGIFLVRSAWKDAENMLSGGPIPPASEERIEYIEKVLDERRKSKD